ncbi:hypothetical protein ABENE_11200 [Asticcacaulis benevestitus DSM 16100 = ATCC BAA-896]|uniref:SsuA/THI5-like domain-containing protein n=1 Tax=Asticcacaulis benevestitus DSM 16100 = ATCC BAA-896 TaxID=1121022 RepID=V4PZL0_9CAUL|nr:hypothetical protein ABENE_11200 [Asticcacaulis benevestitus DSM 16100 = ATCC BAA-896]
MQDSREPALRSQHFYHDIKTLIREGGNVHPLWTRADNLNQEGRDHTVVVGLTWHDEAQVLLGRPGATHDLRGKRLGLSKAAGEIDAWRAMALRAYDTALTLEGLTFDDVVLTDVQAPPLQWQNQNRIGGTRSQVTEKALLDGEVDVIFAKGANSVLFQQAHGLEVILDINRLDDPTLRVNNGTPRPITVHRHFLNDHPHLVKVYLQVINAAALWVQSHEEEVAGVTAKETTPTCDTVHRGYAQRFTGSFDVNLDPARIDALQSQADFLYHHKLIDARVKVSDWIDIAPLLAAKAEPITLPALKGLLDVA